MGQNAITQTQMPRGVDFTNQVKLSATEVRQFAAARQSVVTQTQAVQQTAQRAL